MAASGSNGKGKGKGKGFAGLDSMVSDVSADIDKAAKAAPPKAPEPPPAPPLPPTTPPVAPPSASGGNSNYSPPGKSGPSGVGWVIAGVVILVILIANSGSGNKTSTPSPRSPEPTYSSQAPVTPPVSAPVSDTQKPAIGRNQVLGVAQIRYCKTEKIRIEAFESVINNAYNHEVDRFNGIVSDYNSRCGEFRYRRGDVERVEHELAPMSASIAATAKSEWVRSSLGLEQGKTPAKTAKGSNEPQRPPSPQAKPSLPKNAKLDYFGTDWECKRGFRKYGNECLAVMVPKNGKLDYFGNDWECNRGFRKYGDECLAVAVPKNGKLDYFGNDWECSRGFRKYGAECVAVQVPKNGKLDYFGNDFECKRGYRKYGDECVPV